MVSAQNVSLAGLMSSRMLARASFPIALLASRAEKDRSDPARRAATRRTDEVDDFVVGEVTAGENGAYGTPAVPPYQQA